MRRTILLYGIAMAVLIGLLKFVQYQFFVRDLSIEFYIGIVAVMFVCLGAWAGNRLTKTKIAIVEVEKQVIVEKLVPADPGFTLDESELERLGISKREYEVLELISQGLSNQEIADKLFVSTNTIKTHSSNLFMKLDARRRTQAIQRARELRLLP
jgi:DNA-binding CsgD family transcriptional regulator